MLAVVIPETTLYHVKGQRVMVQALGGNYIRVTGRWRGHGKNVSVWIKKPAIEAFRCFLTTEKHIVKRKLWTGTKEAPNDTEKT